MFFKLLQYTCFYIFFWWTCRLVCSKYKPIDNNPAEPVEIIDRPTELHNAAQTPVTPEVRAHITYHRQLQFICH